MGTAAPLTPTLSRRGDGTTADAAFGRGPAEGSRPALTAGWMTLPGEYRAQRMISGIVGFLPYIRMPTR